MIDEAGFEHFDVPIIERENINLNLGVYATMTRKIKYCVQVTGWLGAVELKWNIIS